MRKLFYLLFFLPDFAKAQFIHITVPVTTICSGTTAHFAASDSGVITPHYRWERNNLTVGSDSTGFTTTTLSNGDTVGSSRVDLQACKLEYSIVSPK